MQILKFLDLFFGAFINVLLCLYIVNNLFINNKNIKKDYKYILITSLIITIINIFNKYTFKLLLTFPFIVYLIKKVFYINYKKSTVYSFIAVVCIFSSELIASIIFFFIPFDYDFIFNNILGTILGNIVIVIISYIILKINVLKIIFNKIFNYFVFKEFSVYIYLIIIILLNSITYKSIFKVNTLLDLFVNFIIYLSFILITFLLYKENLKYEELNEKYNDLFNFLEKFEKEIIEKRKIIHDFNNKLIIINGYVNNQVKLKEYISEIIKEQKELKNNNFINNIDKLPLGIKGLIYYKFSQINKNIDLNINVKNSLKKFEKIPSKLNKEVLTIIGVIIDNSIEAVEKERKKSINIEISCKKNSFLIKIENTCTRNININEINNVGYSTKGKNRGYGLSLINDITSKEDKIKYNVKIEKNIFTSEVIIKI